MGMVLSVPMVLAGVWAMARGQRRRRRTAGMNAACAERIAALIAATGPISRRRLHGALPVRSRATATTRRASPSARTATSSPRRKSARCSANWSPSGCVQAWQAIGSPPAVTHRRDRPRPRHADEGHAAHARPARRRNSPTAPILRWSRPARAWPQSRRRRWPAAADRSAGMPRIDTLPDQPAARRRQRAFRRHARSASSSSATAGWRERAVGLDADGALQLRRRRRLRSTADALPPDARPCAATARSSKSRRRATALMAAIAERIAANGGCGLFIDYGHLEPGLGDTLQAVRGTSLRRRARQSRRSRPHLACRFRRAGRCRAARTASKRI